MSDSGKPFPPLISSRGKHLNSSEAPLIEIIEATVPVAGSSGQVLTTGGPGGGLYWSTAAGGSGTVTSITFAGGLSGGTITTTGSVAIAAAGVATSMLQDAAVTYAKIQNVAASSLVGNPTGSPAAPSEITLGTGLSFSGTTLAATGGTGTVTTFSVVTANGVSASVANPTTAPAATFTLGAITPTSIGSATTATTQTASDNSTKIATTAFVAACTTISASNIGTGTLPAAQLPVTGLTITQHTATVGTASISGAASTLDATIKDKWLITLDHTGSTAITISGMVAGQTLSLSVLQDSTGTCLATFALNSGSLKWAGGSAPTLTTAASKGDKLVFDCVSSGVVWGMVAGQNF